MRLRVSSYSLCLFLAFPVANAMAVNSKVMDSKVMDSEVTGSKVTDDKISNLSLDAKKRADQWKSWPKVGEAQLTWFLFDVYKSTLKAPNGKYQESQDITPHPFALEINYQRDISKKQLLDATDEQWQKLNMSSDNRKQGIAQLETLFPDIKKGQKLTYVTDGAVGKLYYDDLNNVTVLGDVDNEWLNDAFLSIWLSPQTEYPELRNQLIGK